MSRRKANTISQEASSSICERIGLTKQETKAAVFNVFQKTSPEQIHIRETFPWISDFIKQCQHEIGIINMKSLLKLMTTFHKNASLSVSECYSRPNRASKLKLALSNALQFFHMTYTDFHLPNDHMTYLQKLSDLMAMYLDMEIKASRTGAESIFRVASRITSALAVYFGNSTEYIFDSILKAKMITKNTRVLCDLIFRWVLRDSPGPYFDGISYIRHLLVFKIWKVITLEARDKQVIVKLACTKLRPPPGIADRLNGNKELFGLLPKIPRNCPDITDFLMKAKFCSRDQIKHFLAVADDPAVFLNLQSTVTNALSSDLDHSDKTGMTNVIDDLWTDLSLKPINYEMFGVGSGLISISPLECKDDDMYSSEKDDMYPSQKDDIYPSQNDELGILSNPNPLLQNLLIQDDEISKSEIDVFDNPEEERDFATVDSVYNEDIVCHEEPVITRSFSPPKTSEPEPQERIRKFKTPAELKLQSYPPFYEPEIIKLALTTNGTKRKKSPPPKGRKKTARRKSPRAKKGSLQKMMTSALEELENADNWIESST